MAIEVRKRYNQGNILGTVSESAGVPTGAIIERGSNANGEYVKFSDGTLIITMHPNIDYSLDSSNTQSFTAPVQPIDVINCFKAPHRVSSAQATNADWAASVNGVLSRIDLNGFLNVWVTDTTWGTTADFLTLIAIGRWY